MIGQICVAILFTLQVQPNQSQRSASSPGQTQSSPEIPEGEAHFTPEKLKDYYLVYKNADVRYLRTLLDAYAQGKSKSAEESRWLDKWSKDYYQSKFVLLSREGNTFGATLITIMFQDKPDKVFVAWVYPGGEDRALTLGRFELHPKVNDDDIKRIRVRYRALLEDKTHAM